MAHRIARAQRAAGLGLIAALASACASASPIHLPGHHAKVVVPTEGQWYVRAGQTQDIWTNTTTKAQAMQTYLCLTPRTGLASRVSLILEGRTPMEIEGCTSLYLLVVPGERVVIANPGVADAIGTYRFDLQGQAK